MNNKSILYLIFILVINFSFAQELVKKDSIKVNKLDEVVITGQYSKQSVKKSVFDVTVINSKTIEQNAANNLADLLNQNLSIQVTQNAKEGKSTVNLFGLDGQYFKIMQDGIPMISEDGFGNNIDLTQINLDNVKQIEIVEGSMGVTYGANAVSGVINIITKTNSKYDWSISSTLQEETAGNEYAWFDKGKHIQKLHISHNINDNFFANVNFHRNHFSGYLGERKGKNHFLQDNLRGHEWLPKEQTTISGLISYSKENTKIIYKTNYFKAFLNRYDRKVKKESVNGIYELTSPDDKDFLTNRMSHDLIINTKIKSIQTNIFTAYKEQIKKVRRVTYDLHKRTGYKKPYENYLFRKTYFSKATFNHFTTNKPYDFEVGFEYNLIDGYSSAVSSILSTIDAKEKFSSLDSYISGEYTVNDKLLIRPGFRYSMQSKFKNQLEYSLSSRYFLKNNFELRSSIGSSYRVPSFDELYTEYVDSNHNVTGDENLTPEKAYSIKVYLKKTSYYKKIQFSNKLKFGYLNVKDKIDLATIATTPDLIHKYINVDKHFSIDYSLENSFKYKQLNLSLNGTLQGISDSEDSKDFLYTFIMNSNLSYSIKKWHTNFNISYKYNGAQSEYYLTDEGLIKNTLDAYSWVDASIKSSLLQQKIEISLGVRNLSNVTRVKSSFVQSGIHTDSGNRLLGYGRSYFFKLKYKLNI